MEKIVIIGAGQAAAQAVQSLRAAGVDIPIAIVGDEPFPPYQRPPLSKAYLAGSLARERLFLKPQAFYREADCELRLGVCATSVDRRRREVRLADGNTLSYSQLLFASGATPRRLRIPGVELPGVHYLRGIADVDALQADFRSGARLAVVGGGYIGLEVAAVAVKHGLSATVIEAESRVMPRTASEPVARFFSEVHRAAGVTLVLGAGAQAIEGTTHVEAVRTAHGAIPADVVLIGVGVAPNDALAREAGLSCGDGIVVDEFCRTSDEHIFAAGDCTVHPLRDGHQGRLESVQNAIDQARHAALAMAGTPVAYREVPWFWSDQYDLKLQAAGLARPGDRVVVRGDPAARKFAVFHLRDGIVAAVEAVNAAPEYIVGRKLIADNARVDSARLADTSIPMKSIA